MKGFMHREDILLEKREVMVLMVRRVKKEVCFYFPFAKVTNEDVL